MRIHTKLSIIATIASIHNMSNLSYAEGHQGKTKYWQLKLWQLAIILQTHKFCDIRYAMLCLAVYQPEIISEISRHNFL